MIKRPFLIDGKSIEAITEEGVEYTTPLPVQEENTPEATVKKGGSSETSSVNKETEVFTTCYFKSCPVAIVKLVEMGRPIPPWRVLIRGRLALNFPGISVGSKIFVPKESIPFSKGWSPRMLPSFSLTGVSEGLEALSGVVDKVFPYHLDERVGESRDRHLSVLTKSGSLYLVGSIAVWGKDTR